MKLPINREGFRRAYKELSAKVVGEQDRINQIYDTIDSATDMIDTDLGRRVSFEDFLKVIKGGLSEIDIKVDDKHLKEIVSNVLKKQKPKRSASKKAGKVETGIEHKVEPAAPAEPTQSKGLFN